MRSLAASIATPGTFVHGSQNQIAAVRASPSRVSSPVTEIYPSCAIGWDLWGSVAMFFCDRFARGRQTANGRRTGGATARFRGAATITALAYWVWSSHLPNPPATVAGSRIMTTVISPSGLSISGPHNPSRKGFVAGSISFLTLACLPAANQLSAQDPVRTRQC